MQGEGEKNVRKALCRREGEKNTDKTKTSQETKKNRVFASSKQTFISQGSREESPVIVEVGSQGKKVIHPPPPKIKIKTKVEISKLQTLIGSLKGTTPIAVSSLAQGSSKSLSVIPYFP